MQEEKILKISIIPLLIGCWLIAKSVKVVTKVVLNIK